MGIASGKSSSRRCKRLCFKASKRRQTKSWSAKAV